MIQEVKGCNDCPLFYTSDYDGNNYCSINVVDKIEEDHEYNPITPDWCPLKKEPITIQLKHAD